MKRNRELELLSLYCLFVDYSPNPHTTKCGIALKNQQLGVYPYYILKYIIDFLVANKIINKDYSRTKKCEKLLGKYGIAIAEGVK